MRALGLGELGWVLTRGLDLLGVGGATVFKSLGADHEATADEPVIYCLAVERGDQRLGLETRPAAAFVQPDVPLLEQQLRTILGDRLDLLNVSKVATHSNAIRNGTPDTARPPCSHVDGGGGRWRRRCAVGSGGGGGGRRRRARDTARQD